MKHRIALTLPLFALALFGCDSNTPNAAGGDGHDHAAHGADSASPKITTQLEEALGVTTQAVAIQPYTITEPIQAVAED